MSQEGWKYPGSRKSEDSSKVPYGVNTLGKGGQAGKEGRVHSVTRAKRLRLQRQLKKSAQTKVKVQGRRADQNEGLENHALLIATILSNEGVLLVRNVRFLDRNKQIRLIRGGCQLGNTPPHGFNIPHFLNVAPVTHNQSSPITSGRLALQLKNIGFLPANMSWVSVGIAPFGHQAQTLNSLKQISTGVAKSQKKAHGKKKEGDISECTNIRSHSHLR